MAEGSVLGGLLLLRLHATFSLASRPSPLAGGSMTRAARTRGGEAPPPSRDWWWSTLGGGVQRPCTSTVTVPHSEAVVCPLSRVWPPEPSATAITGRTKVTVT